jgi:hypothetical protein
MTIEQAIKTLDAVIPPHTHMTVDREHMPIVLAWETVKEVLKRQRWIPVEERLPESDGDVLTIVTGKVNNVTLIDAQEIGSFDKSEGWILEMWPEWEDPKVTHWMPLPGAEV